GLNLLRFSCKQITSLYVHFVWWKFKIFGSGTNLDFYFFSSTLTHIKVVLGTHIIHNIICKNVTSNFYGFVTNNSAKSDHGNFSSTTSYIHNHISFWLHNIYTNTNSSCHWFVY